MVSKGEIEHVRIGRRVLFKSKDIDDYIESQKPFEFRIKWEMMKELKEIHPSNWLTGIKSYNQQIQNLFLFLSWTVCFSKADDIEAVKAEILKLQPLLRIFKYEEFQGEPVAEVKKYLRRKMNEIKRKIDSLEVKIELKKLKNGQSLEVRFTAGNASWQKEHKFNIRGAEYLVTTEWTPVPEWVDNFHRTGIIEVRIVEGSDKKPRSEGEKQKAHDKAKGEIQDMVGKLKKINQ
jgi:hypothetical protein